MCVDESQGASFVVAGPFITHWLALPPMAERSPSFSLHFGDVPGTGIHVPVCCDRDNYRMTVLNSRLVVTHMSTHSDE